MGVVQGCRSRQEGSLVKVEHALRIIKIDLYLNNNLDLFYRTRYTIFVLTLKRTQWAQIVLVKMTLFAAFDCSKKLADYSLQCFMK